MRTPLARLLLGVAVVIGTIAGTSPAVSAVSSPYTAVRAPDPTGDSSPDTQSLSDVSCPAAGDCVAVGYKSVPGSDQTDPVIEVESNSVWKSVNVPPYASSGYSDGKLLAVSCAAVGTCVAVGYYGVNDGSDNGGALIATLANGSWTTTAATTGVSGVPSAYEAELTSVSCPTTTSCVAVGDLSDVNLHASGLVDDLANGSWTASVVAAPVVHSGETGLTTKLVSVSCAGAGDCVGVGKSTDDQGYFAGVIVTDDDGTISAIPAGNPADGNGNGHLTSVSCLPSTECVAVGDYAAEINGTYHGQIDMLTTRGTNGDWSTPESIAPSTANNSTFASVSCDANATCAAVGYDDHVVNGSEGDTLGLVVSRSLGGTWSATEVPAPANGQAASDSHEALLSWVSCGDDSSCVAGGYYQNQTTQESSLSGLIVTATPGGAATGIESPVPSDNAGEGVTNAVLNSVVCVDSSDCTGVGSYVDKSDVTAGLIVTNSAGAPPTSPKPAVSSVSPARGPKSGGTTVTLTGAQLTGATSVLFGTAKGTHVNIVSAAKITVRSPAHSPATVDITVTTAGGTSTTTKADRFTYVASPTVSGVSPHSGSHQGGSQVTIKGTGFSTVTGVHFGGVAATHLKILSSTKLTVRTPSHKKGTVDVTVTTAGGTSATGKPDHYTFS